MDYQIIEKNNQRYVKLSPGGNPIQAERDALELLTLCTENGTNLLLLPEESLSDDFLHLRTGLAGAVLQKFAQYGVKAAAVLDMSRAKGRFREFLAESNRGGGFRCYESVEKAESWLLGMEDGKGE